MSNQTNEITNNTYTFIIQLTSDAPFKNHLNII